MKTDKHKKSGSYVVSDLDNHVFVLGQYKNGKKDSIWNYTNESGIVVQKYNYTDSAFVLNNFDDDGIIQSDYKIEETEMSKGCNVLPPCQVGGKNYGFYLLYDPKSIPPQVQNQTSIVKMTYSLNLDTIGKVQDAKVMYAGPGSTIRKAFL